MADGPILIREDKTHKFPFFSGGNFGLCLMKIGKRGKKGGIKRHGSSGNRIYFFEIEKGRGHHRPGSNFRWGQLWIARVLANFQ